MAVISISGMSTWSLSWANAMKFRFMVADSSMVWSAGESEDDVGWIWAQWTLSIGGPTTSPDLTDRLSVRECVSNSLPENSFWATTLMMPLAESRPRWATDASREARSSRGSTAGRGAGSGAGSGAGTADGCPTAPPLLPTVSSSLRYFRLKDFMSSFRLSISFLIIFNVVDESFSITLQQS